MLDKCAKASLTAVAAFFALNLAIMAAANACIFVAMYMNRRG